MKELPLENEAEIIYEYITSIENVIIKFNNYINKKKIQQNVIENKEFLNNIVWKYLNKFIPLKLSLHMKCVQNRNFYQYIFLCAFYHIIIKYIIYDPLFVLQSVLENTNENEENGIYNELIKICTDNNIEFKEINNNYLIHNSTYENFCDIIYSFGILCYIYEFYTFFKIKNIKIGKNEKLSLNFFNWIYDIKYNILKNIKTSNINKTDGYYLQNEETIKNKLTCNYFSEHVMKIFMNKNQKDNNWEIIKYDKDNFLHSEQIKNYLNFVKYNFINIRETINNSRELFELENCCVDNDFLNYIFIKKKQIEEIFLLPYYTKDINESNINGNIKETDNCKSFFDKCYNNIEDNNGTYGLIKKEMRISKRYKNSENLENFEKIFVLATVNNENATGKSNFVEINNVKNDEDNKSENFEYIKHHLNSLYEKMKILKISKLYVPIYLYINNMFDFFNNNNDNSIFNGNNRTSSKNNNHNRRKYKKINNFNLDFNEELQENSQKNISNNCNNSVHNENNLKEIFYILLYLGDIVDFIVHKKKCIDKKDIFSNLKKYIDTELFNYKNNFENEENFIKEIKNKNDIECKEYHRIFFTPAIGYEEEYISEKNGENHKNENDTIFYTNQIDYNNLKCNLKEEMYSQAGSIESVNDRGGICGKSEKDKGNNNISLKSKYIIQINNFVNEYIYMFISYVSLNVTKIAILLIDKYNLIIPNNYLDLSCYAYICNNNKNNFNLLYFISKYNIHHYFFSNDIVNKDIKHNYYKYNNLENLEIHTKQNDCNCMYINDIITFKCISHENQELYTNKKNKKLKHKMEKQWINEAYYYTRHQSNCSRNSTNSNRYRNFYDKMKRKLDKPKGNNVNILYNSSNNKLNISFCDRYKDNYNYSYLSTSTKKEKEEVPYDQNKIDNIVSDKLLTQKKKKNLGVEYNDYDEKDEIISSIKNSFYEKNSKINEETQFININLNDKIRCVKYEQCYKKFEEMKNGKNKNDEYSINNNEIKLLPNEAKQNCNFETPKREDINYKGRENGIFNKKQIIDLKNTKYINDYRNDDKINLDNHYIAYSTYGNSNTSCDNSSKNNYSIDNNKNNSSYSIDYKYQINYCNNTNSDKVVSENSIQSNISNKNRRINLNVNKINNINFLDKSLYPIKLDINNNLQINDLFISDAKVSNYVEYCKGDKTLELELIKQKLISGNTKYAIKLIKNFNYELLEFPNLFLYLNYKSYNYLLSNFDKKYIIYYLFDNPKYLKMYFYSLLKRKNLEHCLIALYFLYPNYISFDDTYFQMFYFLYFKNQKSEKGNYNNGNYLDHNNDKMFIYDHQNKRAYDNDYKNINKKYLTTNNMCNHINNCNNISNGESEFNVENIRYLNSGVWNYNNIYYFLKKDCIIINESYIMLKNEEVMSEDSITRRIYKISDVFKYFDIFEKFKKINSEIVKNSFYYLVKRNGTCSCYKNYICINDLGSSLKEIVIIEYFHDFLTLYGYIKKNEKIIFVDAEWKCAVFRENPIISIFQIALKNTNLSYIIDVKKITIENYEVNYYISELFRDESIIKIGVAFINNDMLQFKKFYDLLNMLQSEKYSNILLKENSNDKNMSQEIGNKYRYNMNSSYNMNDNTNSYNNEDLLKKIMRNYFRMDKNYRNGCNTNYFNNYNNGNKYNNFVKKKKYDQRKNIYNLNDDISYKNIYPVNYFLKYKKNTALINKHLNTKCEVCNKTGIYSCIHKYYDLKNIYNKYYEHLKNSFPCLKKNTTLSVKLFGKALFPDKEVNKEYQIINWNFRPLSFKSLEYAILDVLILKNFYNLIQSKLPFNIEDDL
ncbi:conserved Plasmodium protein, unknown function [Plasmodium berghei]|uniref:3'-5' exonuclease domain-containing protein n=2 Tax=Plasmodium berghei TaxID=5821 RepID=A0A509ADS2_PLABA|nr:conserved Plasmodium protein, unknown function [Plasmodium berghei ANKA]SCL90333.1 conserved Plasmodium protein, unknown function [Plasmodium berghei]SCM15271.1 conserved Plasmodium protein, unknown function [Plasmodium berghei]SCM17066.1 conserved Plasmodium protein, unknown function [Plasmodium berghei]SCN21965.1 conserved Plasmodium protein, unknown function [Plasmodium berghei]VUC53994.1 conserved Plasmodium protein, unknown function [Plasmodium berghei ANKA]|eukprot:XP_034419846.1 conserved Plasmodium protein, unknown function [Plasmodium berghei ANKA]